MESELEPRGEGSMSAPGVLSASASGAEPREEDGHEEQQQPMIGGEDLSRQASRATAARLSTFCDFWLGDLPSLSGRLCLAYYGMLFFMIFTGNYGVSYNASVNGKTCGVRLWSLITDGTLPWQMRTIADCARENLQEALRFPDIQHPIGSPFLAALLYGERPLRNAMALVDIMRWSLLVSLALSALGLGGRAARAVVALSFSYFDALEFVFPRRGRTFGKHSHFLPIWTLWSLATLDGPVRPLSWADLTGRSGSRGGWSGDSERFGAGRKMVVVCVAFCMFASGSSKVRVPGGPSFWTSEATCWYMAEMRKHAPWSATVERILEAADWFTPRAQRSLVGRAMCSSMGCFTLALELGAPLLLLFAPRRWLPLTRLGWVLAALAFHFGISKLTAVKGFISHWMTYVLLLDARACGDRCCGALETDSGLNVQPGSSKMTARLARTMWPRWRCRLVLSTAWMFVLLATMLLRIEYWPLTYFPLYTISWSKKPPYPGPEYRARESLRTCTEPQLRARAMPCVHGGTWSGWSPACLLRPPPYHTPDTFEPMLGFDYFRSNELRLRTSLQLEQTRGVALLTSTVQQRI